MRYCSHRKLGYGRLKMPPTSRHHNAPASLALTLIVRAPISCEGSLHLWGLNTLILLSVGEIPGGYNCWLEHKWFWQLRNPISSHISFIDLKTRTRMDTQELHHEFCCCRPSFCNNQSNEVLGSHTQCIFSSGQWSAEECVSQASCLNKVLWIGAGLEQQTLIFFSPSSIVKVPGKCFPDKVLFLQKPRGLQSSRGLFYSVCASVETSHCLFLVIH